MTWFNLETAEQGALKHLCCLKPPHFLWNDFEALSKKFWFGSAKTVAGTVD